MKILHLAKQDKGGGGGGFDSAYRLHCNMRSAGVESAMIVFTKQSEDSNILSVLDYLTTADKVRWFLKNCCLRVYGRIHKSPYFILEMGDFFPVCRLLAILPFRPDAIIVHWVSTFITTSLMRSLSLATGAPLYWYMADMAPLTGGCHYAFDCNGYKFKCGNCPQLRYGSSACDISHRQWKHKSHNFQGINITMVPGSSWLERQTIESSIFSSRPIKKILLGIDSETFKPISPIVARKLLDIPTEKIIIFFGAHKLSEKRKGIIYLLDALNYLKIALKGQRDLGNKILIVTAGSEPNIDEFIFPFEHLHIGLLQGNEKLAAAYQAADVFVCSSTEDSGPMMINESILCGTPVVSFDMGVASDLVHTGWTGYRARLRDADDMAKGLYSLLMMDGNRMKEMKDECRIRGLKLCHPKVQVQAFLDMCSVVR